jgi:RNA polymerase primary sigma factor
MSVDCLLEPDQTHEVLAWGCSSICLARWWREMMAMVDTELLDELLGTLDDRARYAVEARFGLLDGERKSFREVGEDLGVTAEAARRLVSRAVEGLRDDAERILAV